MHGIFFFSPAMLDSFLISSVNTYVCELTKMLICKQTATLGAAAQLLYRFVEQEPLKDFAQVFVDLGAAYRHVPASDFTFTAGRKTIQNNTVKMFGQI